MEMVQARGSASLAAIAFAAILAVSFATAPLAFAMILRADSGFAPSSYPMEILRAHAKYTQSNRVVIPVPASVGLGVHGRR